MNMMERRSLLKATDNPDRKLDYVITLAGELASCDQGQSITLRYIPDRFVLRAEAYGKYIEAIATVTWKTPEDMAVTVLCDVNNEIVARWVQISLAAPDHQNNVLTTHEVVLEDRQPGWDNPALMGRLGHI